MLIAYDERQHPKRRVLAPAPSDAPEVAPAGAPGPDASAAERWAYMTAGT
jgi:hypothetical protein